MASIARSFFSITAGRKLNQRNRPLIVKPSILYTSSAWSKLCRFRGHSHRMQSSYQIAGNISPYFFKEPSSELRSLYTYCKYKLAEEFNVSIQILTPNSLQLLGRWNENRGGGFKIIFTCNIEAPTLTQLVQTNIFSIKKKRCSKIYIIRVYIYTRIY